MPVQSKTERIIKTPTTLKTTPTKTPNCPAARCARAAAANSRLAKKIPDADAQMKGRSQHTNYEKCEIPRDSANQSGRLRRWNGQWVIQRRCKDASRINESDESGPALQGVEPIAHPRILRNVGLSTQPDVHAITAVIQNGQKNEQPFHENSIRNGLQVFGSLIIFLCADQGRAIRPEMLGEECANRNNTG